MGRQDEQEHDSLAPEVMAALADLAQLAQQAGSGIAGRPGSLADLLLKRLLVLCAAQHGAILLTMQNGLLPEQELSPSTSDNKGFRTLALRDMSVEKALALLATFPQGEGTLVQDPPGAPCWLGSRFPISAAFLPQQDAFKAEYPPAKSFIAPTVQTVQIALLLGWTRLEDAQCVPVVEKTRNLLLRVADAVRSVIVSMLLVERIRELEAAAERGALREMELLKAELLATVSHELRSPLASIKGYTATLLRHGQRVSREERHDFLLAIQEASNRLETIIHRLLEMSELETGAIHIERAPTDVARLAREAITAIEQRVSERSLDRFTFYLRLRNVPGTAALEELLIMADQRRLREVLDHLLENAMNYSPDGGAIDVIVRFVPLPSSLKQASDHVGEAIDVPVGQTDVQPSGQVLEMCVCDNGLGIPPEHLDRIFERFHRVDTSLTREVNGLGLGLTICKRIVELHQGIIWAESCPSGGSAFHVRLPTGEEEKSLAPLAGARIH